VVTDASHRQWRFADHQEADVAYKTVLVHCDASASVSQRAAIAASVAQACGSQLVGLHVRAPFEPAARFSGITLDQLYRRYEQRCDDDQAMALSAAAAAAQRPA
jgi:hypothetical protein